jgi:hypothetical protein
MLKLRSHPAGARELLAEDPFAARLSEHLHLKLQVLTRVDTRALADVHNGARGRGKTPGKKMNFCTRVLQTKISSKT